MLLLLFATVASQTVRASGTLDVANQDRNQFQSPLYQEEDSVILKDDLLDNWGI